MNQVFKLENKELLFDTVFYSNPQPMWFYDRETFEFLEVNQAAVTHYGYSREEFLRMKLTDIRPAEDIASLQQLVKRLASTSALASNIRHKLKSGAITHVLVVSYPASFKNREVRLAQVHDVTEIKNLLERFELVSKATHDAIWDWNLETNHLWWNQSFLDLFGYHKEELQQTIESWTEHIHPEDRDRVVNSIHNAIDAGEMNWVDEYRFRRKDGSYAHVLDRGYTIFEQGKPKRMLGSMMDVSMQTQLKQERAATEQLLQTITSAVPTALWMSDADGNVTYANEKWIEWSNADLQDSLMDGWIKVVHPEDRQRVMETFQQATATQTPYQADYRILFPGGSVRWITAMGLPRYNDDQHYLGMVGSCTDITKQKYLEQQKDNFINTVSHELKTPITSIKGYEQLLSRSKAVKDMQGQSFLNRMRVQINRLDALVQDLLEVSRIESGKLTFKEDIVEANTLLAELISDLQLAFPTHRIVLLENPSCEAYADKSRLIQLVTNLIDNAVKYSPGSDKVAIRLACEEDSLTISVQDFGKGISKEQAPFIFERFYQVNNVYKAPGLGLGLYICKEIVQRHNGQIWFESALDQGSTFFVKLPRKLQ